MSKDNIELKNAIQGKPYRVKWRYKGKEFEDTMTYAGFKKNDYYFKDDSGDFLISKIKNIISITTP